MPVTIYTTAAVVRACHDSLSATNFTSMTDEAIEDFVDANVEPDIDATLKAAGYTIPVTDTYGIVGLVEAFLAAAEIMRRYAQQMYGGGGGVADMMEAEGRKRLARIVNGEMDIGTAPSSSGYLIARDQSPDVRPASETYVGRDPDYWAYPTEERA